MSDYVKKPVVIEAFRYGIDVRPDWFDSKVTANEIITHCGTDRKETQDYYCEIKTLEGVMTGRLGDYIIKGVDGECYPCKPDIFEKTYSAYPPKRKPLPDGVLPMTDKVVRPDNVGTRKMIVKRFPIEAGEYLIKNAKFRIGDVVDVWHEGDDYYVDGCGVSFGRSMLRPIMTVSKFKHITPEHLKIVTLILKSKSCKNILCDKCPFHPRINRVDESDRMCHDFDNFRYKLPSGAENGTDTWYMAKDFIEMIKDEMPELTPDIEAKYKTVNVKEATEILNKIDEINRGEKLPTSRTMKIEGVPANLLPDLLDLSNGDVYEMFEIDDKTMQFEKDGITIQLSKDFCKEVELEFKDPKEGPSTLGIYTALKVLKRYCMERYQSDKQQCIKCPLSKLCNGNGPNTLYKAVLDLEAKIKSQHEK